MNETKTNGTPVRLPILGTTSPVSQRLEDAFRELRRGLEGTWFMPTDRGDRLEIWWKEDDQTLAGKNVRIKPENGDTVLLERLRIELRDTNITYIAIARGQNSNMPVSFLLTEIDEEGFFVFSNPEHDDPQTIRYLLLGNREMQVFWQRAGPGTSAARTRRRR